MAAIVLMGSGVLSLAIAQSGIIPDGNAAVTGFSGAQLPAMIAPGVDPGDKAMIDLAGPAVRVIDLQQPGAPPQAQVLAAPKPFTAPASQVGQVFGVALDNASPPNIYVAATSAYGLPIVAPNKDKGDSLEPVKQGTANASFMAGLFGPAAQGGGPGSIWRIDGATGAVSLFANVALDGVPNSGPALGGLAFDATTNTLFVADRETGMIHGFDMNGKETGRFDHGVQGRPAAGLPATPFDPTKRVAITSSLFKPSDPGTWGYAPTARRIFGLAARDGRLFYAVAEGLQVWSVAIGAGGQFGSDPRMEVAVPPGPTGGEISKIAFDDQGRMLVAERAPPSGDSRLMALTQAGGRVLRFAPISSAGGPTPAWQPAPAEYAIGFPDQMRNGNGGVAIGYGYDPAGMLDRNACGSFLWSTGERLRAASDPTLAAQLAAGGSPNVNGLQGAGIELVRPDNAPPLQSYFVDYDDSFDDPDARGHVGDVVVFRRCARAESAVLPPAPPPGVVPPAPPSIVPPAPPPEGVPPAPLPEGVWPGPWGPWPDGPWPDGGPPPPPPICAVGTHLEQGGPTNGPRQCCPVVGGVTEVPGFNGQCQSHCANGSLVPQDNLTCELGFQAGHGPAGAGPVWGVLGAGGPGALICWDGQLPSSLGPGNSHWNKKCAKPPLAQCQAGFQLQYASPGNPATPAWEWSNARCVPTPAQAGCPAGQQVGSNGACANLCPAGQRAFPVNRCCLNGTAPNVQGQCNPGIFVPPLWYLDYLATGTGQCVVPPGNPPVCSFYEFTITARERFGRGSLTQRITLPAGSALEARIIRGSKYCPASAWSCSKDGDVLTCSADHCALDPGDQVVLRLDGRVAPNLTEAPATPIEKTACGVLEWQAMPGPGAAVIEQIRDLGRVTPPPQRPVDGVGTDQFGRVSSKQACWTIQITGGRPTAPSIACPSNYVPTADGLCCLASQMTRSGTCCPAGQRPDPDGRTCSPRCTEGRVWTGSFCACPAGTIDMRGRCLTPPPPPTPCASGYLPMRSGQCCLASQITNSREVCCPPDQRPAPDGRTCAPGCPQGRIWTGGRCACPPGMIDTPRACLPPSPPCGGGKVLVDGVCRCPAGTVEIGGRCITRPTPPPPTPPCPDGKVRVDGRCICPEGTIEMRGRCISRPTPPPPTPPCPAGKVRVDGRCICPEGTIEMRGRCMSRPVPPPPCAGGKVRVDGACVCPAGTYERGGRCVPRGAGPETERPCPAETIPFRGRCVERPTEPRPIVCPPGYRPDPRGHTCVRPIPRPQPGEQRPGLITRPQPGERPGLPPSWRLRMQGEPVRPRPAPFQGAPPIEQQRVPR